jgi:hypothetical protein
MIYHSSPAILESMRSERKRKMENDAGYDLLLKRGEKVTKFSRRVTKKKRKTAKVDDNIVLVALS